MSYSQSKQLTDSEKKLLALRKQLFGKEGNQIKTQPLFNRGRTSTQTPIRTVSTATLHPVQDLTYLKKDLKKISILASLAFVFQLFLYMQFNFNFFSIKF